jgi:outer membrane protein assembly factor BamB
MRKWISTFARGAIMTCCSLLLAGTVVSASVDPHTSYVGDNVETAIAAPIVKPTWSLAYEGIAATGEGKAFYMQKGKVIAVNIQNGKKLWEYGSQLKAPLVYKEGRIYVNSGSGSVHAVHSASGKKAWVTSTNAKAIDDLVVEGDQLFVLDGDITAYSIKNGKHQWRDNYNEFLPGKMLIYGDYIWMANELSGAYTFSLLHAFNRKTGKEVWNQPYYGLPIAAKGGTVTVQKHVNLFEPAPLTTLDTIDVKTGKVLRSVRYNPLHINLEKGEFGNEGVAWISEGYVYVSLDSKVYRYPENADPATTAPTVFAPEFVKEKTFDYAAGPYNGKLLFTDGRRIYGVKLANKTTVSYNDRVTGLIARFDLIGRGMYAAQTDGTLSVIDLASTRPVLQMKTGSRVFGETLSESGMIVVQAKGKLLAFKEPASLRN